MFAQRLCLVPRSSLSTLPVAQTSKRSLSRLATYHEPAFPVRNRSIVYAPSHSRVPLSSTNQHRSLHVSPLLCEASPNMSTSNTMTAFRYYPGETTAVRETLPVPAPRPDEVVIKILAGGVCHSDLSILDPSGSIGEWTQPFTLGHEGAGVITALGSDVSKLFPNLKKDMYVAVLGTNPCFKPACTPCSTGKDNLCPDSEGGWYGIGRDGFWAEYSAVRGDSIIPIPTTPEKISPAVAALCTDAVLTPYHALKTCIGVKPSDTVMILGCGGLGINAIQIAKGVLGASCVIGCDVREESLKRAKQAGADYVVTPDDLPTFLAAQHLSPDVVVDIVGTQHSFDTALSVVKPAGLIHILGLMAPSVQFPLMRVVTKDLTVKASFWGCKQELIEVFDAAAKGQVKPEVETRPLEECLQVLKEFHEGKVKGRIALVP
ncbi:unnamed protein product [Somion occarium]|uniref:Enoyl reductase (ER) domain-containing protein n=1 Tax=Somion occarium TaxID=3059160 RepID=A0ABP1DH09_9APHY